MAVRRSVRSGSHSIDSSAEPSLRDIARAANALRARNPDITPKAVAKRLRERRGWIKVTEAVVLLAVREYGRNPGRRVEAGPASSRPFTPRPSSHAIAIAAFGILTRHPGIGLAAVVRHLWERKQWTEVTEADVQRALRRHTRRRRNRIVSGPAAHGTAQSKTPDASATPGPYFPLGILEATVCALRANRPDLSIKGLAEYMRGQGWSGITSSRVRGALERGVATPRYDRKTTIQARVSDPPSTEIHPHEMWSLSAPEPGEGICPSCGVRVSIMGLCRCS